MEPFRPRILLNWHCGLKKNIVVYVFPPTSFSHKWDVNESNNHINNLNPWKTRTYIHENAYKPVVEVNTTQMICNASSRCFRFFPLKPPACFLSWKPPIDFFPCTVQPVSLSSWKTEEWHVNLGKNAEARGTYYQ